MVTGFVLQFPHPPALSASGKGRETAKMVGGGQSPPPTRFRGDISSNSVYAAPAQSYRLTRICPPKPPPKPLFWLVEVSPRLVPPGAPWFWVLVS